MAPVHGVAAEAATGGIDSCALSGNARAALAELRYASARVAGHNYFCRLLAARGAIGTRTRAEMDSLDRRRRGATDVSGAAALRHHRDQCQRHFFRAGGGTHHGPDFSDAAQFSGLGSLPGRIEVVSTGLVGPAATSDGNKRQRAADRWIRIDRTRISAASESI